jgi:hypothetical protein
MSSEHDAAGPPLDGAMADEGESKSERRSRKDAERENRPLDSWERYRALSDHVDHLMDVVELADRKTRFALLILGTLNAANVLVAARLDTFVTPSLDPVFVEAYVAVYVLLSLYFFVYAIVALKPRMSATSEVLRSPGERHRLRLIDDVLVQDLETYYESWRTATGAELNREMAMHAYILAATNAAKYTALHRVYFGLFVLVAMTAVLAAVIGIRVMLQP